MAKSFLLRINGTGKAQTVQPFTTIDDPGLYLQAPF